MKTALGGAAAHPLMDSWTVENSLAVWFEALKEKHWKMKYEVIWGKACRMVSGERGGHMKIWHLNVQQRMSVAEETLQNQEDRMILLADVS